MSKRKEKSHLIGTILGLFLLFISGHLKAQDTLIVNFNYSGNGCSNYPVTFTNLTYANKPVIRWDWIFGDGGRDSPSSKNTIYAYSNSGNFTVSLIATLSTGLKDTFSKTIKIKPTPDTRFNVQYACMNGTKINNIGVYYTWYTQEWYFNDSTLKPTGNLSTYTRTYNKPGIYSLKIVNKDTNGCIGADSQSFTVLASFKRAWSFVPEKPCVYDSIQFRSDFVPYESDTIKYTWDFGDATVGYGKFVTHIFSTSITTTYSVGLKVEGNKHCMDTLRRQVTIYSTPQPVYIHADTTSAGGNPYYIFKPSNNAVIPKVEYPYVNYEWRVYRGLNDSLVISDTALIIPDTFKAYSRLDIRLFAKHNSGGCVSSAFISGFNGLNLVHGNVYCDINQNYIRNSGDTGLSFVLIEFNGINNKYYSVTDKSGNYNLRVLTGDSFQITYSKIDRLHNVFQMVAQPVLYISKPKSNIILDLPMFYFRKRDAEVEILGSLGNTLVRGDAMEFRVRVKNNGDQSLSGLELYVNIDSNLTNFSSVHGFTNVNGNPNNKKLTIASIKAWEIQEYKFVLLVNVNKNNNGQKRRLNANILFAADTFPENNTDTFLGIVRTAHDPNLKTPQPEGIIYYSPKQIKYTIQFQNEGDYPARNIVLRDTLDYRFMLKNVIIGSTSHKNFSMEVENGKVLVFKFLEIHLKPKTEVVEGSIGWINFYLNIDRELKIGDSITNRAGIYFDYESVVNTPFALVKRGDPTTRIREPKLTGEYSVFPNPGNNWIHLSCKTGQLGIVRFYDALGKEIAQYHFTENEKDLDISDISPGIYTLRFANSAVLHFMKQ
ncbi:MAG: PKD domain-containing protein [Bacteroidetes bacterium]|nr:PKD domain-containing protein [Bacteroidota bacterium]